MAGRALVIDDEPLVLEVLARMLGRLGYTATTHTAAESGLAAFEAEPWDLVLVDLTLPGISGLECVRRMRLLRPGVRVMVASGHVPDPELLSSMEGGAPEYLQKPFQLAELRRVLSGVAGR